MAAAIRAPYFKKVFGATALMVHYTDRRPRIGATIEVRNSDGSVTQCKVTRSIPWTPRWAKCDFEILSGPDTRPGAAK